MSTTGHIENDSRDDLRPSDGATSIATVPPRLDELVTEAAPHKNRAAARNCVRVLAAPLSNLQLYSQPGGISPLIIGRAIPGLTSMPSG